MMLQNNELLLNGNILAVDDNPDNLELLRRLLTKRGYNVRMVTNGADALTEVSRQLPELILLDISMPGMNGYEVSRLLKDDHKTSDVPIIFISALDDIESKLDAFTAGGVDYITKPFHSKEVIARVQTHLTLRRVQKELLLEKKYLEATGNAISDLVILTNCDGLIRRCNQAVYTRFHIAREEIIDHDYLEFLTRSLEVELSVNERELLPILSRRSVYIQKAAGWFEISSYPIWVADSLEGYVFTLKEITAYKEAEIHERQAREFAEAIHQAGAVINSSLCIDEVLDRILEEIQLVIPHISSNIMLVEGPKARIIRTHGYHVYGEGIEKQVSQVEFDIEQTPNLKILYQTGLPFTIQDTATYPGWQAGKTSSAIRSWLGAPIIASSRVIAFITLDHTRPNFYSDEHSHRLSIFAAQASMAIENAQLYEEVNKMATVDFLTGLYNRRHFFTLAEQEVQHARETNGWLGLIMFDLDHLKEINTRYGHIVGGQSLQAVGGLCRDYLPAGYIPAVYGGDEFAILIPGGIKEEIGRMAEGFRKYVETTPIETYCGPINITISLGVTAMKGGADLKLEGLIDQADKALYLAKDQGRNSVCIWQNE